VGENTPNPVTQGHYNIFTCCAGLQQREKTTYNKAPNPDPCFAIYLDDVEDTTPICKDGRPGSFVGSELNCKRAALSGFISKSCCMSLGRTLNTACRSFFNFWQVSVKSTAALPNFSI
jgi:hypothetical protein